MNPLRYTVCEPLRSFPAFGAEPIRLKYHDGGCDRNDSHGSVVLANIAEFLMNDLDYMVSMRCVPHQSYKDPAEHVMATLNLGQQCLALARSAMAQEEEDLIRGAGSMGKIRKVIEAQEDGKFLTMAIQTSLKEPTRILAEIYKSCIFSGRHINVHRPAFDDEVAKVNQASCTCLYGGDMIGMQLVAVCVSTVALTLIQTFIHAPECIR